MFTDIIRKLLRIVSVGLAGTVAAVLFGPTLAANAATFLRPPLTRVAALKPLPEKQYDERFTDDAAIHAVKADRATYTATPKPKRTPTRSVPVVISRVIDDSKPIPSETPSPTAIAESTAPTASPTPTDSATATPTPTASATSTPKPTQKPVVDTRAIKVAAVLAYARAQLGEAYVYGGAGPNVWDCSGLTMEAFSYVGIYIGGHSSNAQYDLARSKGYLVPFSSVQPGDLVFWGSPGDIYHVAIYSGGGKIIEAANESEPVEERPYWGTPYAYAARFIR